MSPRRSSLRWPASGRSMWSGSPGALLIDAAWLEGPIR
jgi:hypothetical protein